MAVNRVSLTINSRQYVVVAQESTQYLEKLGNHINEKVQKVRSNGQNVLGERPIVLAALNICDEYFKSIEAGELIKEQMQKCTDRNINLQKTVNRLQNELNSLGGNQLSLDESARGESQKTKNRLNEANNQIKFLKEHIERLETKVKNLEEKSNGHENTNKPTGKNS